MAKGLYNLAKMQAAKGEDSQALALMQRAEKIQAGLIDQVMGFTNESQKSATTGRAGGMRMPPRRGPITRRGLVT